MLLGRLFLKLGAVWTLAITLVVSRADATSCVWKVTGPNGRALYLGGSIHALRSTDYPLPSAYIALSTLPRALSLKRIRKLVRRRSEIL
jgi:uncharacterized protein YbaP (TraB family)